MKNINDYQDTIVALIHQEFKDFRETNSKEFKEFKQENSNAHDKILDDKEKVHKIILEKIDRQIEAANALASDNRKSYAELSTELTNLKLRDASFYGKVVIISGIVAIGGTILLQRLWDIIIDFLTKK